MISRRARAIVFLVAMLASACSTSTPGRSVVPRATPSTTTTPAPTTSAPETAPALCVDPGQSTGLSVTRSNPFPNNDITFVFPDHVTSTDHGAIAALATTACQLPVFPSVPMNCPADFGISYALAFIGSAGKVVATIEAMPTGCPTVTGLGPTRSATSSFWDLLAIALGLPAPREYCDPFRGRLPNAPTQCGPLES